MKKRNRVFLHRVSNVRTAPKHIDRKIAERKLALFGHDKTDNTAKWAAIEAGIQSAFKELDINNSL